MDNGFPVFQISKNNRTDGHQAELDNTIVMLKTSVLICP